MNANLQRVGGFNYTPEEVRFGDELRKTLTGAPDVAIGSQIQTSHIQKVRTEFEQERGPGVLYKTRLADRKPALDSRK